MNLLTLLSLSLLVLNPLPLFNAASSEQVVEGNVGITLSMEIVQQEGEVNTDAVFSSLVNDGSTDNTVNASVRVSTNSSDGLNLNVVGNHTRMFRDTNLNNTYDDGEVTMLNPLKVVATPTGRFTLNISEVNVENTSVRIGSTTGSVNNLEVPITWKIVVDPVQEAGNYIMVVTFNVANR